jgi:putative phosphoesterase
VRVAVIADTHMPRGARALPPACLDRLAAADLILHAGDLTGPTFLDQLRTLGPPVEAVHGNMDEPTLQARLPAEREVEVGEARIGMVHIPGARPGREERLAAQFPRCHAVVYGHTHMPQVELVGGVWILNPGSPTERRSAPARSMLELTLTGRTIRPELVTFDP